MEGTPLEFTDRLSVEVVDYMGSDLTPVNAARVSLNQHSDTLSDKDIGLMGFLLRNRHSSPFEHATVSFLVEVPLFVRSEWHRHRTQSYNEWSGRYSEYVPKFYMPNRDRPLIQQGKPGAYTFTPGTPEQYDRMRGSIDYICSAAWVEYQAMLKDGVAKEVARIVLPPNLFTKFYATANLRNWLGFLSLRTDPTAMEEIRLAAAQVETRLHHLFPNVMNLWDEYGRGAV